MKSACLSGLILALLSLSACNQVRNQDAGMILGGALGGLVGAQIGDGTGQLAATAAGALLGAYVGNNIGRSMDEVDRMRTGQTLESAPTGETSSWRNPDTGAQYAVTPTRTYESSGMPCREFTTEAVIDGKQELVKGTACRRADGSWQVI